MPLMLAGVADGAGRNAAVATRHAAEAAVRCALDELLARRPWDPDDFLLTPEGHIGDPAARLDALTHREIERVVRLYFPDAWVWGEEAMSTAAVRVGEVLVLADSMDGTEPGLCLTHGFAAVVMAYERLREDRWRLLAASIATSNHLVATLIEGRVLVLGQFGRDLSDDMPVASIYPTQAAPGRALRVAVVGAKPEARKEMWRVDEALPDDAVLFGLGGNPVLPGLILGALDAVICLHPQTPWDAALAPFASTADASVSLLSGDLVSHENLLNLFSELRLADNLRSIPPLVIARDEQTVLRVVDALQRAGFWPA